MGRWLFLSRRLAGHGQNLTPGKREKRYRVPSLPLQRIYKFIPELIKIGTEASFLRGVYRVTFETPGKLMRAANGQGFRALVVDGKHRIVSHGVLSRVGALGNVTIVWQIAAAATAQYYLVEIWRDLKKIKSGIEQIQKWLSHERIASLQANAKVLAEIDIGLSSDKSFLANSMYYQNALGEIDRDCSKIARACALDLLGYIDEVQRLELRAFWSSDGRLLLDTLPRISAAIDAAALALIMRIFNTGLLSSLLGDLNISKYRADDTRAIYSEILKSIESFESEADRCINCLSETMSSSETVNAKKAQLRLEKNNALAAAKRQLRAIPRAIQSWDDSYNVLSSMLNRSLTVDVEFADGQPVYRL